PTRRTSAAADRRFSDDGELADRLVALDALVAERGEIEGLVVPGGDPLGEAAADRRRLLEAVAAEPVGEHEVPEARMRPDDGVVVERVDLVVPGPCIEQAKLIEGWHPVREGGPDERLERRAVRDEVEGVRVRLPISWGPAAHVRRALGPGVDADRVDRQRGG